MMNFNWRDIRELIRQRGDRIEIGIRATVQPVDSDHALRGEAAIQWREVEGYFVEQTYRAIPIEGQTFVRSQKYMVYLMAQHLTQDELEQSDRRIRVNGKVWQYAYTKPHRDKGILRMHELELTASQADYREIDVTETAKSFPFPGDRQYTSLRFSGGGSGDSHGRMHAVAIAHSSGDGTGAGVAQLNAPASRLWSNGTGEVDSVGYLAE